MYYKLFETGQKTPFDVVELMNNFSIKEGSVINYNRKKWKVINIVEVARTLNFDDKGKIIYPTADRQTREGLLSDELPELYVTEIPVL
jgi:hypothetical protein